MGLISGSGRSPGEGNGNPLQYSCLENTIDGVAWQATAHEVLKSGTRPSDQHTHVSIRGRMDKEIFAQMEKYKIDVCMHAKSLQLCPTPWTIACQARLAMGLPRQEYQSRLLCPPSGDLPNPGVEPMSLASPALAGRFFTTSATWEAIRQIDINVIQP